MAIRFRSQREDAMTDKYKGYHESVNIEQFANAVQLLDDATRYDSEMR